MESFKKEVTLGNIADTYNGRPWEEVSTEELETISHISLGAASRRLSQKAKEILEERKAAEEATKNAARKALDDGTVKGLIVSRAYTNVGEGVAIQNIVDGVSAWTICGGGCCSSTMTVTSNGEDKSYWANVEETADNIRTFCRRKFKKEDIILFGVDSFYSTESGIVFLEDKICSFDQKKLEYIITYAELEYIDFTENSVIVKVSDGQEVSLYCGDNEEYRKNMYNLIMDIKDRLAEHKQES